MALHDIIVIGASAGGIEALNQLVQHLPGDLPASLFVVVHFPSWGTSYLPQILARVSRLPVNHARDGEPIQPGEIYLAPPDYHLILQNGSMHLIHGPREHGFRPAIDPLFRSAAAAYASRVTGIVLSGSLSDGAVGLLAIQRAGGLTIVQDPDEALFSSMPLSALDRVQIDYVLPVSQIAATISSLADQQIDLELENLEGANWMSDPNEYEADFVQGDIQHYISGAEPNRRSVMTCPGCGGVVWELHEGELLRFRCHVGHVYSAESMLAEQASALEMALWTSVRALEERSALLSRLASRARETGSAYTAERFQEQAQEVERQAGLVRKVLMNGRAIGLPQPPEETISADKADDHHNPPGKKPGSRDGPAGQ